MKNKITEKWKRIPLTVKISTSYAVCSILQRCLSFFTVFLFTRIMSQEQYGQYTIYSSWSGIFVIFLTLNLAYGSFSTAMTKFEDRRDEYIASVEGICLILAAIFCVIYLPFRNLWNKLFELPTPLILVMVLEALGLTAIQLWSGKKRFEFKYKSVIVVTLLSSVIAPVLALILVYNSEEKGYARIFGYAITTIVFGGFLYIYNLVKGKKLYNKEFWKYALGFNVPLLAYYLSQVIFNQSDRIMISHIVDTGKAAMYGVAYNLATILTFVLNAINNSYVPWYYGKLKENKQQENKSVSCGIAVLMSLMLLCVIWFAPEIITLMAGKSYYEATWVVPPVAMSLLLLFYAQLFINVEFYFEEKKALVGASLAAAIINIVLNALLIPRFGFVAAGYTTLVSYMIFAEENYRAMKKVLRQRGIAESGYDMKNLLLIVAGFFAMSFLGLLLYDYLVWRIVITVVVFVIVLRYRNVLIQYIKQIRK